MTTASKPICDLYYESYALIEQGICFDEVSHNEGALEMYQRGLALIETALKTPGADADEYYKKMSRARNHVVQRISALQGTMSINASHGSDRPAGAPPVYPGIPSETPFESISGALMAMGDVRNVEEVFCIPNGVQIFFIQDQETSVPSYPTSLKIFKFQSGEETLASASLGQAFLQVGDWIHPLQSGSSIVLHSDLGAYMFPDPKSDHPDGAVGVILPSDIDASVRNQFEQLMNEFTVIRHEAVMQQLSNEEQQAISSKLSRFLTTSAEWLVWGIEKGTEQAQKQIEKQSEKVKQSTTRADPDAEIQVDPRVQTSIHYLRRGSKVGVRVSGYIVNKLGNIAVGLGRYAAGKIENKLGSGEGSGTYHSVVEVGSAGFKGAATVWIGLEQSAKILAKSLANETVHVVNHKYGENMGVVTDDALKTVYNVGVTALNVDAVGVKAIAKRTVKETGKHLLQDLEQSSSSLSKQSRTQSPAKKK